MKSLSLLLIPAALLLGCSSGTQYERGAYMPRPPAPTFDPMTDAPHTTGQPGYVNGQRVERSPNRRYSEPSREAQMMAADGDDARTVELMFSEPVPKDTPKGIKRDEFSKCWQDFLSMMQGERKALAKFSPGELRCMRHKVISHCGARQIEGRLLREGKEYDSTFEDLRVEQRAKACGRRDEFNTGRVVDFGNTFMNYGDDELGWRPSAGGYRN